jgi:hypothetical protein
MPSNCYDDFVREIGCAPTRGTLPSMGEGWVVVMALQYNRLNEGHPIAGSPFFALTRNEQETTPTKAVIARSRRRRSNLDRGWEPSPRDCFAPLAMTAFAGSTVSCPAGRRSRRGVKKQLLHLRFRARQRAEVYGNCTPPAMTFDRGSPPPNPAHQGGGLYYVVHVRLFARHDTRLQPALERVIRPRRAALLAEYLVGPLHQRYQVRRSYKPSIFAVEVSIADRTGP